MSSTGCRLMRTQLVRRLAAGARARSANGIDARARSANGIDAERVARRRRWRPAELSPLPGHVMKICAAFACVLGSVQRVIFWEAPACRGIL